MGRAEGTSLENDANCNFVGILLNGGGARMVE